MDETNISQLIDHHRWLLNNGIMHDDVKNHLFLYGSIVHKDVKAVDLVVDMENKTVHYDIYINKSLLKKINKFQELRGTTSLYGLWQLKRLVKNEGNLDFALILNNFIKDYCGSKWVSTVEIHDFKEYKNE